MGQSRRFPSGRACEQVRRILRLIDLIAPYRYPTPLELIHSLVTDATGIRWSLRTLQRDLALLASMGLVVRSEAGYVLDLKRSEAAQFAACHLFKEAC